MPPFSSESPESIVLFVLWCILGAVVLAILWLFIARWDLIDRLSLRIAEFWRTNGYEDDKSNSLAIEFLKAKISGRPIDDGDFAKLPTIFRNDSYRRAWYAVLGLIAAGSIGVFGGFILYTISAN